MIRVIRPPLKNELPAVDERIARWTNAYEVQLVCWLASRTPGNILEIGCNEGLTTRDLALTNPEKMVVGVDYADNETLCPEQRGERPDPGRIGIRARDLPNVRIFNLPASSLRPARIQSLAAAPFTFFFIDGDHTYSGVKADTELAIAYLRAHGGGMIAWHDCYENAPQWVGVQRYLAGEVSKELEVNQFQGTWVAWAEVKG